MATRSTTLPIDPVCGIQLSPNRATPNSEHAGKMHHFCSRGCETEFDRNPDEFEGSDRAKSLGSDGRCGRQG